MELLPMWMLALIAFCYGTVIGSFSAVLVYRMHTGKSLNTRSRCLSCGHTLAWYELVPIVSFLALFGRCRTCHAKIPRRDFVVETTLGILYLGIILFVPNLVEALIAMFLVTVLLIVTVYDLRHLIIPDELVIAAVWGAVLFVGYRGFMSNDLWVFFSALMAGMLAFFAYASLWFVSRGRWIGFGDAKLAFPLGMIVGMGGVFSMVVLSFWVGAFIMVGLLVFERVHGGQSGLRFQGTPLKMKSEVPFAPFLVIAWGLVHFFGANVLSLTTYALG